jgi:hypothetical protein
MAGGLFFISMFFITVISILLFAPGGMEPYPLNDPNLPTQVSQQEITMKMARFLETNPKMVKPETFRTQIPSTTLTDDSTGVSIRFLNSDMSFPSKMEYHEWVNQQVRQDPEAFIHELNAVDDHDLFLNTLKSILDSESDERIRAIALNAHFDRAEKLISKKDLFSQEMTQRSLQQYLDLEKDPVKAKKMVDDFLSTHTQQPANQ